MESVAYGSAEWAEQQRRRRERHLMVAAALVLMGSTALTVYLSGPKTFLSLANNILLFWLLFLNVLLICFLLFLVVRNLIKLLFERKRGIFGSKLRTKFVAAFVGFSGIPAVLLFVVAISYIGKSTNLWLNSQIEQSLLMSRQIVEAFQSQKGKEGIGYARLLGRELMGVRIFQDGKPRKIEAALERKRREFQLDYLAVFSLDGMKAEAFSTNVHLRSRDALGASVPFARLIHGEEVFLTRQTPHGSFIQAYAPLYSGYDPKAVSGFVVTGVMVPPVLGARMEAISRTYEQYKLLRSQQRPIQLNYIILLTVVLLAVIFLASWFGFYLSKQITIPLQALARKTQEVALGKLDFQIDEPSKDEVGVLVDSFNQMISRLRESQRALEASHVKLQQATEQADQRRKYMETVLENVSAGVISVDPSGNITTVNSAAEEMLDLRGDDLLNRPYWEAFPQHQGLICSMVEELEEDGKKSVHKEIQMAGKEGTKLIKIQVNLLRDDQGRKMGMVMVLDDLTELQRAQRMTAWKEVARRIAHEIKNPLTPVKLSAQRLRRRYLERLDEEGAEVFDECTTTIIEQVDHLQNLVNEFHRFARMPSANPVPQPINPVVEEVVMLFRGSHPHVEIEWEGRQDIPPVPLDKEQIQRALINLMDNALAVVPAEGGRIQLRTSFNRRLRVVRLEVADNGPGISPADRDRVFEPYFSTKKAGTGLGLAIVRSIVMDHNGYIRVTDNGPSGARFIIELPL
jgi:two-component system nitrogen regulation sensor histidine kinase NtrY